MMKLVVFLVCIAVMEGVLGVCENKKTPCGHWAKKGWCKNPRMKEFMFKACCKSCVEVCEDKGTHCEVWASMNFCTSKNYKHYMRQRCCKSCQIKAPEGPSLKKTMKKST